MKIESNSDSKSVDDDESVEIIEKNILHREISWHMISQCAAHNNRIENEEVFRIIGWLAVATRYEYACWASRMWPDCWPNPVFVVKLIDRLVHISRDCQHSALLHYKTTRLFDFTQQNYIENLYHFKSETIVTSDTRYRIHFRMSKSLLQ